jgi:hypothetical protein
MPGFVFRLEHRDGTPAKPPILTTAVPTWAPDDEIPLGGGRSLRVVAVRSGESPTTIRSSGSKPPELRLLRRNLSGPPAPHPGEPDQPPLRWPQAARREGRSTTARGARFTYTPSGGSPTGFTPPHCSKPSRPRRCADRRVGRTGSG